MTGSEAPKRPQPAPSTRQEVQLDPALHARLLEQMREEQAAALRRRALINWVLLPIALLALVIGTVLMFSDDMVTAFLANTVATGIGWVLWRTNRERIRERLGM